MKNQTVGFGSFWPAMFITAAVVAVLLVIAAASPAFAASAAPEAKEVTGGDASELAEVIEALRNLLVGLLATVATLFLTYGGVRYMTAAGDPGELAKAKTCLRSAAIGYALALMAPIFVQVLQSVLP